MIDTSVAFAAVSGVGLLWRLNAPLDLGFSVAVQMGALMALIFGLVNSIMGLGRVSWRYARAGDARGLALSTLISTLTITGISWLWPKANFLPPGLDLTAGLIAFIGFFSLRYRERLLTGLARVWLSLRTNRGRLGGERVLIIGAGKCALSACRLLRQSKFSTVFSVVGMVDDNPSKVGKRVDGHTVFGPTQCIPDLVEQKDIGVILFAIENIKTDEQKQIIELCRQTRARLVMIPDLMQILRERMTQDDVARQRIAGRAAAKPRSLSKEAPSDI
jgi:FlaA1/EpsC-like NDP-sugar epimerase